MAFSHWQGFLRKIKEKRSGTHNGLKLNVIFQKKKVKKKTTKAQRQNKKQTQEFTFIC